MQISWNVSVSTKRELKSVTPIRKSKNHKEKKDDYNPAPGRSAAWLELKIRLWQQENLPHCLFGVLGIEFQDFLSPIQPTRWFNSLRSFRQDRESSPARKSAWAMISANLCAQVRLLTWSSTMRRVSFYPAHCNTFVPKLSQRRLYNCYSLNRHRWLSDPVLPFLYCLRA
jgi:hypothetical protein